MQKKKIIKIPYEDVVDTICDICQRSCKSIASSEEVSAKVTRFNYATLIADFGYGSSIDCPIPATFHFCETCYLFLLSLCKRKKMPRYLAEGMRNKRLDIIGLFTRAHALKQTLIRRLPSSL